MLNEDPVRKSLQKFWDVEVIGIPSEEDEDIVMESFQKKFIRTDLVMLLNCHLKRHVKVYLIRSLRKKLVANPKLLNDDSN